MWLPLIIMLLYISGIKGNLADEVHDLTEILFANLNADPFLTDNELSENSINFINKQTENYVALMKRKYGINHHWVTKRSVEYNEDYAIEDYDDSHLFDGFSRLNINIAEEAKNIFFISQDNVSSLITFTSDTDNRVAFYRQKDSQFEEIFKELIKPADKMLVYTCSLEVFVITSDLKNVIIYTITNDTLKQMQMLDGIVLIDINIWENTNGIFMAIIKTTDSSIFNTTCGIYKWLGKHFDLVQTITIHGATSISTVSAGNVNFLGIAKYQDYDGQTITYSEIFRYNIDTENYEAFEKVITSGAIDIQFFSLKRGSLQEIFFVLANSLEDENRMPSKINSIIYKYVNKYFFPFQSINHRTDKWLPISGPNGEFLLISSSKADGMRMYNYDGWRFVEIEDNLSDEYVKHGFLGIGHQQYNDSLILKLSNDKQIRLYKLNFHQENNFKNFQKDMLDWCHKAVAETDHFYANELKRGMEISPKVEAIPKIYSNKADSSAAIRESGHFEEEDVVDEDIMEDSEKLEYLNVLLDQQLNEVKAISADLDKYLDISKDVIVIRNDIIAENVILEKDAFFEDDLITETINEQDSSSLLDGLININHNHNFDDNKITFDSIRVEGTIEPIYINDKEFKDLVLVNESLDLKDVIVNGKVIAQSGLKIHGNVNGVCLNTSEVLLLTGDQRFNENIILKTVKVVNGESEFLNKLNLREMPENSLDTISNIKNLKVTNLFVAKFLNGIDINDLNSNALRTFGEQELTGHYTFENLELKHLYVHDDLFNRDFNDTILISDGEYDIDKDVLFTGDMNARKITVKSRINHIKVNENGKLDVLLKNTEENQYVSGYKTFEEVVLLNPINLQVKIDSNRMDNMNPITIVPDEEIIITGNYSFTGKVTVEQSLLSGDMKGSNSLRTMQDVIFEGLEIDKEELPQHLTFQQQLNVEEINVDLINDINPDNFVINGNDMLQDIKGWKTIKSNVHITGSTTLANVNNIHIPYLEKNTLRTEGDQEVTGKHLIEELTATSVSAETSKLGDHSWRDIVQNSNNQVIHGTTVLNSSIFINKLKANSTIVEGLLNGYNLTEVLEDTAKPNTTRIDAHKTFDRLEVENLFVTNGIDMDDVPQMLADYQDLFVIDRDVILPDGIQIENLSVDGKLNDMNSEDFTRNWVEMPDDQVFHEKYIFDTLTVYGKATILSNDINSITLKDIVENTIKTNETFYFNNVTFRNVIVSEQPITLHGEISGLDLENVITSSRAEQVVSGFLTFADDVEVIGNLEFNGLINGFDYDKLCAFSTPDPEEPRKNLIITGNAHFMKGPSITKINNVNIADLYDDVWLTNKDATLTGHIEFEIMNFEANVTALGLVDGVDIRWLSENYFSKTKNQTITGHLDFTDGVNFLSDLSGPEMQVSGVVSGENIFEFVATAILDNVEQDFENTLYIQECDITDIQGDYLVNQLNLPNDVMRYDVENVVTGEKRIPNVIANNLVIDQEDVAIQNVDVLGWLQKGVLKSGGSITKDCIFHNDVSFSKGLGVVGLVNGVPFDNKNIMMRNENQIITGRKRFYSHLPFMFEDITLKKSLNGVDMKKLLENQAVKDRDNVFKTQINVNGDITTRNVNIKNLYNSINVSEMITGLTNSREINNYYEHYAHLLNASVKIRESLEEGAYFLDHYAIVQYFEDLWDIYYLPYKGLSCLAIVNNLKDSITFYTWEDTKEKFSTYVETIEVKPNITYLSMLSFENDLFLYHEHLNQYGRVGEVNATLKNMNDAGYILKEWSTNAAKYIHTFVLPDTMQKCFVITYLYEKHPIIYCESKSTAEFEVYQKLEIFSSSQITTITIGQDLYLFIICDESTNSEIYIDIWKINENTRYFNSYQSIFDVTAPVSISAIPFKNVYYVAIASSHLQDTAYSGFVQIYRFNPNTGYFILYQDILISAPIKVEFSILPSGELVLYILADNTTEPLTIYQYEGIVGFRQKYVARNLAKIYNIKQFNTIDGKHFVLLENKEEMTLLHSYFKGYKHG